MTDTSESLKKEIKKLNMEYNTMKDNIDKTFELKRKIKELEHQNKLLDVSNKFFCEKSVKLHEHCLVMQNLYEKIKQESEQRLNSSRRFYRKYREIKKSLGKSKRG